MGLSQQLGGCVRRLRPPSVALPGVGVVFVIVVAVVVDGSHIKFILPYAPNSPVTCNGGMSMPSWMDLIEIPISTESPDNGLQQVRIVIRDHHWHRAPRQELN